MDGRLTSLEGWVRGVKQAWEEHRITIEDHASEEAELFELKLTNLLNQLEQPVRSEERMYELAYDVYESWEAMTEIQEKEGLPRQQPGAVPIGGHRLPPLPYAYNALEPYISEEIMRLHHDKHHKAYVNDLNKAEKKDARSAKFEQV